MDTDTIVTIIIRNSVGQFFAHQRSPHKKTFPHLYGLGAGGHVKEGETPADAAPRELLEETGIRARPQFLFSLPFTRDGKPYEVHIHEVLTDEPITPEEREWQWWGWLERAQIDQLIREGKLMPDTTVFYQRYVGELQPEA